jgi:hypothetical protein
LRLSHRRTDLPPHRWHRSSPTTETAARTLAR